MEDCVLQDGLAKIKLCEVGTSELDYHPYTKLADQGLSDGPALMPKYPNKS
jgi:hypothetical protein